MNLSIERLPHSVRHLNSYKNVQCSLSDILVASTPRQYYVATICFSFGIIRIKFSILY